MSEIIEDYREQIREQSEQFNTDSNSFERLADALEYSEEIPELIEEIDLNAGGARDSVRIQLAQYTGTVPDLITGAITKSGLEISSVGGYCQVTAQPPRRTGGSLDPEHEVSR